MNQNEIYEMIQIIEKNNLGKLNISDKEIEMKLNQICNFIAGLVLNYSEELKILEETNVRFCDYYDSSMCHGKQITDYFDENYCGKDKDKLIDVFALYVILKNAQDIVYNFDVCDSPEELYDLLDCDNYFEDILETIDFVEQKRLERVQGLEGGLEFLSPNNKYQIFFTGFSYDDINRLEKNVKKAFIKKLSGDLSKSDYIILSENIDHVKALYDFPISRVQFANDYRIAYLRKDDVTAILGVTIKTGKNIDYTRYDSIAMKKEKIYEEIQAFKNGQLSEDSQHYQVVEKLSDFYEKLSDSENRVGRIK